MDIEVVTDVHLPVLVLSTISACPDLAVRASGHVVDDGVHKYVNSLASACAHHCSEFVPVTRAAEDLVGHRLIARVPGRSRTSKGAYHIADRTLVQMLVHVSARNSIDLPPAAAESRLPSEVSGVGHWGGCDDGRDKQEVLTVIMSNLATSLVQTGCVCMNRQ